MDSVFLWVVLTLVAVQAARLADRVDKLEEELRRRR